MNTIKVENNIFDKAYALISLFIIVVFVNLVSSIHFLNIFLLGISFSAFARCLKMQNYYLMLYAVLAILFIELNNGFRPFSVLLMGTFIYLYLIPFLSNIAVVDSISNYLQTILLYLGVFIMWSIGHEIDISLIKILFLNLVIDILLIKILL